MMRETTQNQMKLPQLRSQLRIVVAVAQQESLGQAALELGISQLAVSHAIAALAKSLDVVLLFRDRHGAKARAFAAISSGTCA